jgi:hypothetical protein
MPDRMRWALALAAALALTAGGCGDDADDTGNGTPATGDEVIDISGTEPVGDELAGSVAPLVQCRDWAGATGPEKLATISDIRSEINLEDSEIKIVALTDDEALGLFDRACSESYAAGFRLYSLYARAVGFAALAREQP